jgi:hypothetical protein
VASAGNPLQRGTLQEVSCMLPTWKHVPAVARRALSEASAILALHDAVRF